MSSLIFVWIAYFLFLFVHSTWWYQILHLRLSEKSTIIPFSREFSLSLFPALLASHESRNLYESIGSNESDVENSGTHTPKELRRQRTDSHRFASVRCRRGVSEEDIDPHALMAQELGYEVLKKPENLVEAHRMANNYMVSLLLTIHSLSKALGYLSMVTSLSPS